MAPCVYQDKRMSIRIPNPNTGGWTTYFYCMKPQSEGRCSDKGCDGVCLRAAIWKR